MTRKAARPLNLLFSQRNSKTTSIDVVLKTVREGFRNTTATRGKILTWIGEKYIWEKRPENQEALEIMYHAADHRPAAQRYGSVYNAIYFGLSIVKQKQPRTVRSLADIAMYSSDPATIIRVTWGLETQREELLEALAPYLESPSPIIRKKAKELGDIARGKTKAFAWARKHQARVEAVQLPEDLSTLQKVLTEGDSQVRKDWLQKLVTAEKQESLLMDPELALLLSKDPDLEVQAIALHYGLAQLVTPNEKVAERCLEMAKDASNPALRASLELALGYQPPQ